MSAINLLIETKRLTIRSLTEADVPVIASIWADAQVTRFLGGPWDFETVCNSLKDDLTVPPARLDLWPVVERSSGNVVGHCGLLPKTVDERDEVELTYVLAANCWGKGYATEAAAAVRDYGFRTLAIMRLVALIDIAHIASERVALKLGMEFEANTMRPSGKTMRVYAMAAS
jgi:ribosomal-protein-alanine N-acetyltransferase